MPAQVLNIILQCKWEISQKKKKMCGTENCKCTIKKTQRKETKEHIFNIPNNIVR